MSLLTRDYDYELPPELIAQRPLAQRADSRMMVLHRDAERIEHRSFSDFPEFVCAGDLVVLNDTKVIRARLFSDDGKIEILLLESAGELAWTCMVKPGRKMRIGHQVTVGGVRARVTEILEKGERVVQFESAIDLAKVGHMPTPHYFHRASDEADNERYQTVYAEHPGAIAAPTAGLHFTPELLQKIPYAFITLHVGAGTFQSVKCESIRDHVMHRERFAISDGAAARIGSARRVLAVGTTTTRVLESCLRRDGQIRAQESSTDIFIHPPFEFRRVNALLTNFHLPKSTLLMLVSAFAGREFVLRAYAEAIRERYRFYSYGDCMLVL